MTVKELKKLINDVETRYDNLNVWFDNDFGDGGKPVKPEDFQIKLFSDGCFDLDVDSETMYEDEICEIFGIDEDDIPSDREHPTIQWIILEMERLGYYQVKNRNELEFSKKVLTIKVE